MASPRLISAIDLETQVNNRATLLPKYRRRVGEMVGSVGRGPRVCFVGDSLTAGWGAGTDTWQAAAYLKSFPRQLARQLAAAGLPAADDNFFSTRMATTPAAYDTRLTIAAAWTPADRSGPGLSWASSSAGAFSFLPANAVDTVDIYYINPSGATFSVDLGGVGSTTPTLVQNDSLNKVTVTFTRALAAINIARVTGTIYLVGVDAYDSTTPRVTTYNWGAGGWNSNDWVSTAANYYPFNSLGVLAPDITFFMLGANESNTGVSTATYKANMQTLITKAKLSGDAVLINRHPASGGYATNQVAQNTANYELAATNGLAVVDVYDRWAAGDKAWFLVDTVHCNPGGYGDYARFLNDLLLAA